MLNFKVERCTEKDLDKHYNLIKPYVTDVPEDVYKGQMLSALASKSAYKIDTHDVFLYFIRIHRNIGVGAALYGLNKPFTLLNLIKIIATDYETDIKFIKWQPHYKYDPDKDSLPFASIVDQQSIKNWYDYDKPLIIKVDSLLYKLKHI